MPYRGGRKPGAKDLRPRSTAGWTVEKRAEHSKRCRILNDEQEKRAVELITTEGGPTVMNLAKEMGVGYHALASALDRRMGKVARKQATRARQSESMRGNRRGIDSKIPSDVLDGWRQSRRGSGNPNWRGGSRSKREGNVSTRHLAEYKEFVEMILSRDGYRCLRCGSQIKLIVHHIKSEKEFPELLLEPTNAETLCRACHMSEHHLRGDIN